ncbi:MAG: hypothetical protein CME35_00885 [Gramella sp.]|nr:hypothetical protein [Christiangramia sp.]|tara:strand:- start:1092 stop:2021 length:930 start_codon:yes stop_codon:yes gene_type:complete
MSNFIKPKGVRADGTPYSTQISAKADRDVTEDGDSRLSRTYAAHIRLDSPLPAPRTATTRMIGDEFVWYRLFQTKGRGNAVTQAAKWFTDTRYNGVRKKGKDSVGKVLQGKEAHECVVVDDPWNECSYGSEFNPIRPVNRLLDEETKKRVIEESKGNLKLADSPFKKEQPHPSLEWVEGVKKVDDSPIKVGFNTTIDPSKTGMENAMNEAVGRASERKKNNQESWFKEVHCKDNRKLVRKMREEGTIEHSSAYRKRVGKRSAQSKIPKKKKVSAQQKKILEAELDEWIRKEEKRALARKKIVKNNLTKI